MKEQEKELWERFEKLKKEFPVLENKLRKRNFTEIDHYVKYLIWLLYKLDKKLTGKGSTETIEDIKGSLWYFWKRENNTKENKRKYLNVKKQYNQWAKRYDVEAKESNIATYLEEKSIKDFMPNVKNKEVLDFGCGTGRYTIPLAKRGANITAIDLTPNMIKLAKKKAKKEKLNINFKNINLTKFKPDKEFDLIISMLVLDHIKNLEKAIFVISKASKVGTEVIISNIHPEIMQGNANKKTGRAQGYLVEGFKTDQFYHPLEEYVNLFLKYGFILKKIKDIFPDEEDLKSKKMKEARGLKGKSTVILMKFKKIK